MATDWRNRSGSTAFAASFLVLTVSLPASALGADEKLPSNRTASTTATQSTTQTQSPRLRESSVSQRSDRGASVGRDDYLRPSGNAGYDVESYNLKLHYEAKSHGIKSARVIVRARTLQRLTEFSLDAKSGLAIQKVRVNGHRARFRHSRGKLHISRFGDIGSGSRLTARVAYSGKPKPLRDKSGRGRFGWLPTRGGIVTYSEPDGTSTWVPSNDVFYDKAVWRMDVTVPRGLLAVSTGQLLKKARTSHGHTRTVWRTSTPIQSYAQVLAIDEFSYRKGRIAGIPSFVAVSRYAGISVSEMTRRTRHAIKWLTARLGKYPYPQTGAIVVSGGNSAMETAGRPTYSDQRYYTSQATVVHEQAHQWFGNLITASFAKDMWLHEGFATYLENVESAARRNRSLDDVVHDQYVVDGWERGSHNQFQKVPLADPTPRYLLNTTVYFRGQAAVHALRLELGNREFWSALRKLVDTRPGRSTDTAKVVQQLEQFTGRDLSGWAKTWVYSTGYQELPKAPTHKQVIREIGKPLLDTASDWSWRRRGSAAKGMRRAVTGYAPMNQVIVDKTRSKGSGRGQRIYVDFSTKTSPLYPEKYASCLIFKPRSEATALGSYAGLKFSTDFSANTFTTRACPAPKAGKPGKSGKK
jgi:aminopeptidase N